MNRIQLSDGEEKKAFVQISLTDHRLARRNLDDVAMDQSVTQSKNGLGRLRTCRVPSENSEESYDHLPVRHGS